MQTNLCAQKMLEKNVDNKYSTDHSFTKEDVRNKMKLTVDQYLLCL